MKKMIALFAALLIIGCMLTACGDHPAADDEAPKERLFKTIEGEVGWSLYSICYCKETKVMYSISEGGTMTLLVNPDGSPMIYTGDE